MNCLKNTSIIQTQTPFLIKRLKNVNDEINKNMVESINKSLNKMKKIIKNVPENKTFKIEENKKIIDFVERILDLNRDKQLGLGLKILTQTKRLVDYQLL